jgi:LysR family nod box-dependent transcriptional activator
MTDLRRVDANLIVVLDAVLTERNLTRAGESVGMTQPAVSGSLTKLRQLLDDPLLVRSGRSFELTPKAQQLQPVVAKAMEQIHRTLALQPTFDPATSDRRFYIAGSDYALATMTGTLLSVLRDAAPGTSVAFSSLPMGGPIPDPVDLLRYDVMISVPNRGIPGKRMSLFSDRFVCIASADNPRLRDGRLSLADLTQLRYVRASFGPHIVTEVDYTLATAGITPQIAVDVVGFALVPFMVAGTSLVSFVPQRLAAQHATSLGLVIARTPVEPSLLIEAAHWHPARSNDPALKWLLDVLRTTAELVESDE